MKEAQSGRRFDSRHDIKNVVFQCINSILKLAVIAAILIWISRLTKCVDNKWGNIKSLV